MLANILLVLAIVLLMLGLNVESIVSRIIYMALSVLLFIGYFVSQLIKTRHS